MNSAAAAWSHQSLLADCAPPYLRTATAPHSRPAWCTDAARGISENSLGWLAFCATLRWKFWNDR